MADEYEMVVYDTAWIEVPPGTSDAEAAEMLAEFKRRSGAALEASFRRAKEAGNG